MSEFVFWIYGSSKSNRHIMRSDTETVVCGTDGKLFEAGASDFKIVDGDIWISGYNKHTYFKYHLPLETLITCKKC